MKKITSLLYILPLLLVFTACKKESDPIIRKTKALKYYTLNGFATHPLDQYFDGVKVRQIRGDFSRIPYVQNQIAFTKDEVLMELKKPGGETVYQHTFNINDATGSNIRFYYNGDTVAPRYNYPAPVGAAYTANFFFDFPKEAGAVDVVIETIEYYIDNNSPNGVGVANVTSTPVATNITTGRWSDYITLNAAPDFPPKTRPDSDFFPMICIKKAGTNAYFSRNDEIDVYTKLDYNSIYLQLPTVWTTEGLVQSYYVGWEEKNNKVTLNPKTDLVQLFPK